MDDDSRRLVYAVVGSAVATHHNASFQVIPTEDGRTSLVWISDFLPDTAAGTLGAMIETGAGVMKRTLEAIK